MKRLVQLLPIAMLFAIVSSCSSVRVASDYDQETSFDNYKTFAFFKPGIDKAEISDLDKRRILKAIETELLAKGLTKSEDPDMLISIFTKSNQRVDLYNNFGFGFGGFSPYGFGGFGGFGRFGGFGGFGPYGGGFGNNVSTRTEGILFIDFIDTDKKELIWQGSGTGHLVTKNVEKKEARIKTFVTEMMTQFPPEPETK
ncbi:DUF4136 domain-containing protein [Winogradskyella immobilis]|uniref:DUF4136 domain-containing protein n=1 Tax=Winogradskyella immobilis TaxID=2816852 RepID=A0ABS8EMW8_9FLAO|nr:DUF4136 domain-containing protein [Winogradskyella immobilis]MCC1483920.1 DUF4136 domain-containing protein [Winogradskyella immobilis]MCG0016013.1 DUF4136 domain-containing protein [Winogradskyella immobilis]